MEQTTTLFFCELWGESFRIISYCASWQPNTAAKSMINLATEPDKRKCANCSYMPSYAGK